LSKGKSYPADIIADRKEPPMTAQDRPRSGQLVHGLNLPHGTLTTYSHDLEQPPGVSAASAASAGTAAASAADGVLIRPASMTVLTGAAGHGQPAITLILR
jgi:hypothetical protein